MLKLHCNKCHSFLKEITPDEAVRLKGDEICRECKESARSTLDKYNALYQKCSAELAAKHNKGVVLLEELIRKELEL